MIAKWLRHIGSLSASTAFFMSPTGRAMAQNPVQIDYRGTLGPARIGLTLMVEQANGQEAKIAGGHYFYAKYPTDIPLTGAKRKSAVTLQGQDGGSFALTFVGNGSEGGKSLDFNNSIGLDGTWSKDGKSLPVKLSMEGISGVPTSGRRYETVTDQSDAAFEAIVQGFYQAALAGDRTAMAKYISFPLRVNQNGKNRTVHAAAELSAQWGTVFTPAYLAALKKDVPHDLSIAKGAAMLGAGDAWFDATGATALNLRRQVADSR